jgi:ABC-type Fe3+/spermidine/putrescine transport system ATPase subunit
MSVNAIAVHKSYGTTPALFNVDLAVKPGEFITLLGPSGCGKTTLLRIIAGLERPDSGYVYLNGKDITLDRANQRPINTVFQNYALFPHLDVVDNIAFGLRSRRVPTSSLADSSNASPSRAPSSTSHRSCSSMSPCPLSTRTCASPSNSNCEHFTSASAALSSS